MGSTRTREASTNLFATSVWHELLPGFVAEPPVLSRLSRIMAPSAMDPSPVAVKLTPNRALLNCDFETYKLSLNPVPRYEVELEQNAVVQRSKVQENDDFSLQFLTLQRMHNHAVGDIWVGNAVLYFVDTGFQVVCFSEADMRKAGTQDIKKTRAVLPKPHDLEKLRFHSTLAFPSSDLAVVAAGTYFWLYNTGVRTTDNSSEDQWELLEEFDFSDFSKEGFMIKDAKYAKNGDEEIVSCLLMHVDLNLSGGHILLPEYDSSSFVTIVDWVTLSRHSSEGAWELLRRRRFGGKHTVLLAAIDKLEVGGEDALILASEGSEFRMTFDSEGSVVALNGHAEEANGDDSEPLYEWNQNADSISVTMKLPAGVKKDDLVVKIEPRRLHVEALVTHETSAPEKIGFSGELASIVKPDESTWTLTPHEKKGWSHLEVVLSKGGDSAGDVRSWKELIKACQRGRETIDPVLAAEIHDKLAHLTSETLVGGTDQGAAMSQMEECDGLPPTNSTLVRFLCYGKGEYKVSHKASLSAHQWLFSAQIDAKSVPIACLRHDVDAIAWAFKESEPDNWGAVHVGTFDAFGYVYASKENKKYLTCPPDMSYAIIADSKTHCYIYKKMSPVDTDLKNRKTGKHLPTVAKQFVLTLKHEEVLGVSASNEGLFILTESGLHYVALTGV